ARRRAGARRGPGAAGGDRARQGVRAPHASPARHDRRGDCGGARGVGREGEEGRSVREGVAEAGAVANVNEESARFEDVFELFHAALEVPEDARAAWLAKRCGDDASLLAEVEELLAAHESDDDVLERSADALRACADDVLDEGLPPSERIGPYRIVRAVATGGMGTVFEAEQEHPHRRVALKVLRFGLESESALRRFEYESRILARLRHPGVAHVYDSGTYERTDGRRAPWFAM